MQKHLSNLHKQQNRNAKFSLIVILSAIISLLIYSFPFQETSNIPPAEIIAQKLYNHCKENKSVTNCYKNQFEIWAKVLSFKTNLEILNSLKRLDPRTQICHSLAHIISAEEVVKNPKDWTRHLKAINPTDCSTGFIHGAIEGLERSIPLFSINPDFIEKTCEEISSIKNGLAKARIKNTCAHAMGHILLVEEKANIEKALDKCPNLSKGYNSMCFKGIFMESIFRTNLNFHGITTKPQFTEIEVRNQEKICNNQNTANRTESCWDIISNLYIEALNDNYQSTYDYCNHAPEEKLRIMCYTSAAQYLFTKAESGISESIKNPENLCSPYTNNKNAYKICVEKILQAAIENRLENRAYWFCGRLNNEFRQFCEAKITDISARFAS